MSKLMILIQLIFIIHWFDLDRCKKRQKIEHKILTNIDMLLMTEKGIRGGILHTVTRHAKTNDRNMKNLMKPKILHFYYI